MLSSILYLASLVYVFCNVVIAAPLKFQQQQQQQQQDDWPLSNAVMIRDTIEGFYETVVDDVLSAHTEDLLVMLTHSPRTKKSKLLQSQATTLRGSPLQGKNNMIFVLCTCIFTSLFITASTLFLPLCRTLFTYNMHFFVITDGCLVKMPGYIGNHLHQLNARVFGAIRGVVGEALPAVWPDYDALEATLMTTDAPPPVPQHQIASALYSLNLAVGHRLTQVFEDFDLLNRLRHDLAACDEAIADAVEDENNNSGLQLLTTKVSMTDYIINAGHRFLHRVFWMQGCNKFDNDARFLETWLRAARADLRSELESRVGDLIMTIYNDLYDEEISSDF
ncbi:hypothetical protein BDB00DRAFT_811393 [Zychaea mexicana]|uniref:uncharacterized protein n=1 Tax=Zychaea mexicana TaxID=64656 RepID=UPI0022FF24FE|nr:uncharacterized protein BDB00DRAFT_811393 [Zychaea mexicana]KAI9496013.1 hypothetical protein BDB00DRAFT_811393 [Zychaea mexicana]